MLRTAGTSRPWAASFAGSSSTRTSRPGPPRVVTSRVPGTRFNSASTACATRWRSDAPVAGSFAYSVIATIGTSSMPLGLTSGSPTSSSGGSQSRCDRIVSCSRTTASLRETPTLYWTVIIAWPGFDTDQT